MASLWTDAEIATLLRLAGDGVPWPDVSTEIGRTRDAVIARYQQVMRKMPQAEVAAIKGRRRLAIAARAERAAAALDTKTPWAARTIASPKQLADRDARERARLASAGALLLGDPPPGWSALDQRGR